MKLPEASKDFENVKPGTYLATCFSIVDLGTHKEEYQGEESWKRKLMFQWELPEELMESGEPFIVSKWYTLSMGSKANLRKDLEAWRNKPFTDDDLGPQGRFDIENVIGASCLLNVVEKALGHGTKVGTVMALPKGQKSLPLHNRKEFFSIDEPDELAFEALSDWKKNQVRESKEYQALMAKKNTVAQAMPASQVKPDADPQLDQPYTEEVPF